MSGTGSHKYLSPVHSPSKLMEDKDWEQRSMMTATSKGKLQFAFHTFENCVGPGQY